MPRVSLRAYASLNDFLDILLRGRTSEHLVGPRTSVKDFLERLGVPHVEVELLLINEAAVGFERLLDEGDRVAAFPRFFALDISTVSCVRVVEAVPIRFVLDVHLGRLARHLRLAGIDTAYAISADDDALAAVAASENRILLTRDIGLLKRRVVAHGYFVRSTSAHEQFVEVLRRFGPLRIEPFSRCLRCNGLLRSVEKTRIADGLPTGTREHYDEFWQCDRCGTLYWRGTHYERLSQGLGRALREAGIAAKAGWAG